LKTAGLAGAAALGGLSLGRAAAHNTGLLRPPGGDDERRFLAACIRCGQCVEACPIDVLRLAGADGGLALGTPYFVARENPCDLCQGRDAMQCIEACPTGALRPLARRRDVRIGVARIDREICLPWVGVACKACWHACPFPNEAIVFDQRGRAVVVEEACVGCGLCEHVCLTPEPAIRVERP
jgi:MauM/NapG family ferredoxin protein